MQAIWASNVWTAYTNDDPTASLFDSRFLVASVRKQDVSWNYHVVFSFFSETNPKAIYRFHTLTLPRRWAAFWKRPGL